MEEDWDNLIILDACRYDLFEEVNDIEGELSAVISAGSNTSEFLIENFENDTYYDTVYVSANPQIVYNGVGEKFYHLEQLWQSEWDDEYKTVLAGDVVDCSKELKNKYPNKRFIIHLLQPHYPFIGEYGQSIEHGTVIEIDCEGNATTERDAKSIWTKLEGGEVNKSEVWLAYKENLELVLPEIQRLIEGLQGRTVVTSDHGNAVGELGLYGHPRGKYLKPLIKVPWLVHTSKQRVDVEPDSPEQPSLPKNVNEDTKSKLEDLGYL
jgi:hypothetical protein